MVKNPTHYFPILVNYHLGKLYYYEDDRYAVYTNWVSRRAGTQGVLSNRNDLMLNFHVMVF